MNKITVRQEVCLYIHSKSITDIILHTLPHQFPWNLIRTAYNWRPCSLGTL
jgi:hypothetical protein